MVARADYYINKALAEPRVIGLVMFLGPSQTHSPMVKNGSVVWEALIGAWDMSAVEAKWRFIGRALGFGPANTELQPGQQLVAGQYAKSPDGRFSLKYQTDGNLVLYRWDGVALWATNAFHTPGRFIMQGDGNLGIYDANGNGIWFTWTQGNPGAHLRVLNSGTVVVVNTAGTVLWQSGPGGY
jgi:hypothetical protein